MQERIAELELRPVADVTALQSTITAVNRRIDDMVLKATSMPAVPQASIITGGAPIGDVNLYMYHPDLKSRHVRNQKQMDTAMKDGFKKTLQEAAIVNGAYDSALASRIYQRGEEAIPLEPKAPAPMNAA